MTLEYLKGHQKCILSNPVLENAVFYVVTSKRPKLSDWMSADAVASKLPLQPLVPVNGVVEPKLRCMSLLTNTGLVSVNLMLG